MERNIAEHATATVIEKAHLYNSRDANLQSATLIVCVFFAIVEIFAVTGIVASDIIIVVKY